MDGKQSQPTKLVRMRGDIADKLSVIVRYTREVSADYLDPLIREKIEQDYAAIPKAFRDAADVIATPASTK